MNNEIEEIVSVKYCGVVPRAIGCPITKREVDGVPFALVTRDCASCEFLIHLNLMCKHPFVKCSGRSVWI